MPEHVEEVGYLAGIFGAGLRYAVPTPAVEVVVDSVDDLAQTAAKAREALEQVKLLGSNLVVTTENIGVVGNSGIVVAGLTTGGIAVLRIQTSKSKTAAVLYTLSFLFSSAAVGTGSVAVLARECKISAPAALSEAFGTGFLFLGNEANRVANNIEGIQTSPEEYGRFLRRMSKSNSHPKGASFVMPGCGYDISNQDIVVVVSVIATVYTYGKIVIKLYRFAQQKIHKYLEAREARRLLRERENEKNKRSKLIRDQAIFLIDSLTYSRSASLAKIYRTQLAVSLVVNQSHK